MMKDFLCCVLGKMTGVQAQRRDIYTDASGINHFTWITEARYQGYDLLSLLPGFMEKFFETGYYEHGPADQWEHDYFAYGNRVKMDLFRRYGALAAAGDRHLGSIVETNCVFTNGLVKPVVAKPLPAGALAHVQRNCANIDLLCDSIRNRDMNGIFSAFMGQPLCDGLSPTDARTLFSVMCKNTRSYLSPYFPELTIT